VNIKEYTTRFCLDAKIGGAEKNQGLAPNTPFSFFLSAPRLRTSCIRNIPPRSQLPASAAPRRRLAVSSRADYSQSEKRHRPRGKRNNKEIKLRMDEIIPYDIPCTRFKEMSYNN
jgi:hypothetical protein